MTVPLTGKHAVGQHAQAMVDAEDYANVSQFTWFAARAGGGMIYAVRTYRSNGKKIFERMHRRIVGAAAGAVVDHLNHNTLDNRRCNLRAGTHQENMLNRELKHEVRTCLNCGVQFVASGLAGSVKRWHCTQKCKDARDLARQNERNRRRALGPSQEV